MTKGTRGGATLGDGAQEGSPAGEFRAETSDEKIDSLADSIGGNMDDPVSSQKRMFTIRSSFVIQTEASREIELVVYKSLRLFSRIS